MAVTSFIPTSFDRIASAHHGFFKRISQVAPLYFLTESDILEAHDFLIESYGGLEGIKNEGYLSYLCNLVEEKYDHLYRSAFIYLWHIVTSHAFLDGNKRLGALCMLWFLESNGEKWSGNFGQLEYLIMAIASGKIQEADAFTYFLRCSGWVIPKSNK
jgi:death on curing protein